MGCHSVGAWNARPSNKIARALRGIDCFARLSGTVRTSNIRACPVCGTCCLTAMNRARFVRCAERLNPRAAHSPRGTLLRTQSFVSSTTYCLIAKAHDLLYFGLLDHTPERRALGDAAVDKA